MGETGSGSTTHVKVAADKAQETFAPSPVRSRKGRGISPVRAVAGYVSKTLGPGELRVAGAGTAGIIAGLAAAILMVIRLLFPEPVGMGDQGDGHRLVCSLGVMNVRPWDYTAFTQYLYPSWIPHQFYGEGCGANGSGEPYYSSQLLFLWLGKLLTPILGWGPGLDTRAVGIVCCIVFGLLITALVNVLPGRISFRVLIAALVTGVMADGIFADFFVSPYSEPAAFLGTLAVSVALLHYWNASGPRWLAVLMVVLSTVFTISAKTQTVSWLPVIALALLWQPGTRGTLDGEPDAVERDPSARGNAPKSTAGRGGLRRRWRTLVLPATAVLVIGVFSVAFIGAQPKRFSELNLYNAVFVELLPNSPTPEEDLRWLGLDQSFINAMGTTVASSRSAVYNPLYHQFAEEISLGKIAVFYITHPERLINMGERGITAMLTPELGYVGSYMESANHEPYEKERRFPVVLGLFSAMKAVPVAFVGVQLLTILLGFAVAVRKRSAIGRLAVVMALGCWLQFWAVMLTEGQSEIYKHMIIAGFMAALCGPLLVALISILASDPQARLSQKRRARRSKAQDRTLRDPAVSA
ncbi:glycan biosynthesis hexose transferase WsfD [Paenarthrobacter nitroguajacolicus]|uniref:glycan biosynthesis hexose transferase WsfD n=1 Tax=Paenarthrobacter nitroguajacolicus TaxID=211146 RepID=UPI0040545AE2